MQTKEKVDKVLEEIEEGVTEPSVDAGMVASLYGTGSLNNVMVEKSAVSGDDKVLMIELGAVNAAYKTNLAKVIPGGGLKKKFERFFWRKKVEAFKPMFEEQDMVNQHLVCSLNELNRMRGEYEIELSRLRDGITRLNAQQQDIASRLSTMQNEVNYMQKSERGGLTEFEYEEFENQFRGSEELIKERLMVYLPYYRSATLPVLEIGSGRGEFLEIMRENNVEAKGVDIFLPFVEKCKDKDLDVMYGNGISYIKTVPDESLGGVFAAQVIEHITNAELIDLCREAYRTLQKGRFVIFETPNPMCLSIYTNAFYIDPSHNKPIHPIYIEYIMKMIGFQEVHILYTDHSKCDNVIPPLDTDAVKNVDEFNKAVNDLSYKLYGSQDYAVIAMK